MEIVGMRRTRGHILMRVGVLQGQTGAEVFGIKGTSLFCTLKNIHIPISSIYIITELRDRFVVWPGRGTQRKVGESLHPDSISVQPSGWLILTTQPVDPGMD